MIACNGINSWIREQYADRFRPSYDWRPNKFVWLGSTRPLPAFTFDFRENDAESGTSTPTSTIRA